jgi:hypothetical protein
MCQQQFVFVVERNTKYCGFEAFLRRAPGRCRFSRDANNALKKRRFVIFDWGWERTIRRSQLP